MEPGQLNGQAAKLRNVELMQPERGYSVAIVCTSDEQQAAYWQQRLDALKGTVVPTNSSNLAVAEDWPGGAGNFLGTLYAWQKACAKHALSGRDLAAELRAGASVALFHTAGKGTRLAPLPGAENNNKPGVKLPGPGEPSILESVIRQTGAYASSRPGRLSVYWGDQVFIPSVPAEHTPQHHADIMCALGPMPSAEDWAQKGLEKYGLIAARNGAVAAMLEKVSHAEATQQLTKFEGVDRVGTSMGSFSLSAQLLEAFEAAFATELTERKGKMDTDPHVWMAVTLDPDSYTGLMVRKGLFDESAARQHHQRISDMVEAFDSTSGGLSGLFGAVNVGADLSWWDYGQLKLYLRNSLLLTEDSADSSLARAFFGVAESGRSTCLGDLGCSVDAASIVSSCVVRSGEVVGSMLANVRAKELRAERAVVVNVCAARIVAPPGSVLYNVVDSSEEGIVLAENEVRVGIFTQDPERPYFEMRSDSGSIDGGQVFKDRVCGNSFSFQEVYDLNQGADVSACAASAVAAFKARAEALGL